MPFFVYPEFSAAERGRINGTTLHCFYTGVVSADYVFPVRKRKREARQRD